jgi:preprotein translocase subunit SecA
MTGTATTEAQEFKEIYKLHVLEIPTHKKCVRVDENDEIYMTEREKYNAILKDIREKNSNGRPILVGTESVEISEKLSRILRQNQIEHSVLNAKHNEREAEVIAHAGKRGAVTIATNMAGRGTDIKLEEGVADLGGLYVLASSRHQSRRIDRQLRGRSARQGDPGSSKFYLSFEDELLRLFASSSMTSVIQRFRPPEGEPISAKMLNRSIETAQKRIEARNYMIRKHTLEYDDVMNKQRQEIYAFRNEVLQTENIIEVAHDLIASVISHSADEYFQSRSQDGGWNPEGFRQWLIAHFPVSFEEGAFSDDSLGIEEIEQMAIDKVTELFDHKITFENEKIRLFSNQNPLYSLGRQAEEVVRDLCLRTLDRLWIEHLLGMDHLRTDVMLRTVAQKDPLMEFKEEAFTLFESFGKKMDNEIALSLFRFQIVPNNALQQGTPKVAQPGIRFEKERSLADNMDVKPTNTNGTANDKVVKLQPVTADPKVGRNNPCPCGSGKKYKACCGQTQESEV